MKVIYTGPQDRVRVVATGQVAERGVPVEVSDELGAQLVAQGWQQLKSVKKESSDVVA